MFHFTRHSMTKSVALRLVANPDAVEKDSQGNANGVNQGFDSPGHNLKLYAWCPPSTISTPTGWLEDGTVRDDQTGLMWSAGASDNQTWTASRDWCASLSTGGYKAWRMPTLAALAVRSAKAVASSPPVK